MTDGLTNQALRIALAVLAIAIILNVAWAMVQPLVPALAFTIVAAIVVPFALARYRGW